MIEYNKILDLTQSIDSDTCDLYLGCGASNNARSDSLHWTLSTNRATGKLKKLLKNI